MSLIISPHTCSMSSSARTSSPAHSNHSSPRLKPPAHRRRDLDASKRSQRRLEPSNHARAIECENPPQSSVLTIDPFLAQYIKPASIPSHELYFRSLKKQMRVPSFDNYQKYLNNKIIASPRVNHLRQDSGVFQKPLSPPRYEPTPSHALAIEPRAEVSTQQIPQRRKNLGSDKNLQPDLKKPQQRLITETLPVRFENCSTSDLINLMARMMQSLISLNDRSVPASISSPPSLKSPVMAPEQKNKLLTRYHSRTPPAISIHTYISRLAKFNNLTPATLLTTIYYIDLLSHNFQPYFTLNSWTVHRFLLVATMLAQKSLEDFFYTNDHYARVGGVALTELNFLELDFLNRVDWKVVPAKQILPTESSISHLKEVLDLYYWQLVNLMGKNISEKDKIIYSFPSESD